MDIQRLLYCLQKGLYLHKTVGWAQGKDLNNG